VYIFSFGSYLYFLLLNISVATYNGDKNANGKISK